MRVCSFGCRSAVLLLLCAGNARAVVEVRAQGPASAAQPSASEARCRAAGADAHPVAPDAAGRAAATLVRRGYANVAAVVEGRCLVATFENTRYRDERRGLREAARLLLSEVGAGQELVLVPTNRAIPLVAARYPGGADAAGPDRPPEQLPAPDVTVDVSHLPPALSDAPRASRSFGRVDVVIHPWFEAVFGNFDNPVESRTGVAPELRVALWPGFSLSAQALVTLQDDLDTGESRVRPALVTANQTVRLPRNVFVSATAGTFNPDRYGVDVEARAYLADGRLSAGAELGLTGSAWYGRDEWLRTPMEDRTALADVTLRIARYDLLLRATGGMFLEEERGVRLDAVRQFGEFDIGFFVLKAEEGTNGGVMLRLPLLPAKRAPAAPLRIRAADAFRWQYRYRGLVPGGRRFNTGNTLEDFGRRLDSDYVRGSGYFRES